jgi:hypothetical protein
MRRRAWFAAAILVSLGLHVLILRALNRAPPVAAPAARVAEFTLVYPPLSSPEKNVSRKSASAKSARHLPPGRPPALAAPATAADAGEGESGGIHTADLSEDAPRVGGLRLLSLAQLSAIRSDKWRGDTQQTAPEAQTLAEKSAEGTARVQGWLITAIAQARAQHGNVHPYFNELALALREASKNPPSFSHQHSLLGAFAREYLASAANYHNPGAPQVSEEDGHIVALVELRQSAEGAFQASLLLESSGSPGFDAHVLSALPNAASHLRAPLLEFGGLHANGLRSVWAFEGSVREIVDTAHPSLQAKNLPLALLAPVGLLSGNMKQVAASAGALGLLKTVYDCEPHLVAVY